ncbi:SLC9A1 family protein [Megaselia abdita]
MSRRRPSSLTQEMNLARRACWTTAQENSQLLDFFSYVYYLFTTTIPLLLQHCKTNSRRTIINTTTTRKNNFSANSEKTSVHHLKQIKFSNKFMLITVISCILLSSCVNYCEARPNLSTGANNGVDSAAGNPSNILSKPQGNAVDLSLSPASSDSPNVAGHSSDEPERYPLAQVEFDRVKTPFIIGVWILLASIAKIGFHMTPKLSTIFPESILLIVVGVIIGIVLYFGTTFDVSPLTPNTFFFYMLPPIILDAGYFMPNRLFFDNLGTILLMAVVGTIFNIVTIGGCLWACGLTGIYGGADDTPAFLDTFVFASLISAVDPVAVLAVFEEIHVNEILYIVVFGESLLNDAVTVVFYHMMEVYSSIGINEIVVQDIVNGAGSFFVVALGGTFIGIIWGFLTGLVTRFTDHVRVIEPIFIFVMAYLAYLNAEIFHMSGILSITFCGITMKNYVESNISQKSHTTIKYALKMLSSSSETIIFMFLGVATVNNNHVWNTAYVLLTIFFCSLFRPIGVIILSAIANKFRLHKLSKVDQFVMSYGGLRGAVAFALVLLIDEHHVKQKPMFVTTTIAVIYFTVFLQGITIKPLVRILNVKRASKRKPTMNERIHERFMDHLMAGIEDIVGKTGNYNVRDKFKRFDNKFIRPLLIRDLKGAEPKIIETYSKLAMKDAMEVMRRNPSTIGQMSGTESMSALFRQYTNNYLGGRCATGPKFLNNCSPSFPNLETYTRNLDMHELDYNPSKKDLTDARIHHLLAEELKPYRRHRRLSYSRHAVDDRDLSTQVNYKMHMNIRRMVNDRKHHKRSKRGNKDGIKQNHVSFHDGFQQNGKTKQFSNDYINEVLNESAEDEAIKAQNGQPEDWEEGLTFTAKTSPDSDRANNNSLIAHITNLPGFDASKARFVKHYSSTKSKKTSLNPESKANESSSKSKCNYYLEDDEIQIDQEQDDDGTVDETTGDDDDDDDTNGNNGHSVDVNAIIIVTSSGDEDVSPPCPTAAELTLPWRRDLSKHSFAEEDLDAVQDEGPPVSRDSESERRVATPTATESQLPWKRNDNGDEDDGPVKQNEFPAWVSNKEYLAYNSPSATFLGGISKPKQPKSVIGFFRRESSGSRGDTEAGSDPSLAASLVSSAGAIDRPPNKRSASICAAGISEGHSGPFPITASHRRNTRRGSMLELSGSLLKDLEIEIDEPINRMDYGLHTLN